VRPESPYDPHHVLENRVGRPQAGGLVEGPRVPEVVRPGEELLGTVQLPGGEQFSGSDDPQRRAQLGTDEVLPPVTARQGEVRRPHAVSTAQERQQRGVFVVGVRRNDENAPVLGELLEESVQRHDSPV